MVIFLVSVICSQGTVVSNINDLVVFYGLDAGLLLAAIIVNGRHLGYMNK